MKLKKIARNVPGSVWAKLEFYNPMGSIKDRIAKHMIERAEKDGRLKPGMTIVENSSGNTALGMALLAIKKGYKLKVVVRDSISEEKISKLTALGVDIIKVDHTLPPEHPDSYNNITPRIVRETPNAFFPDQHNNRENNETHYLTTGPEIWKQMDGKIDYLVAGMGTGGTIGGVAKFLKEKDSRIKVIAIDPAGSIFYDYFYHNKPSISKPYLIEGLGDEFLIKTVDFSNIDEIYQVTDKEAFNYTRRLVREEGIMAGGSSGAALWGCLKLAASLQEPKRIVTIFPDTASNYIKSIFNDEWLLKHNLM
jgi:cystathionine beta-synthase